MNKLEKAFALFDAYNRQDPNIISWQDKNFPAEYFYALKLYEWVIKLSPGAGESLLLASRSQHIGRWKIQRDEYPKGKAGYYKWRTDLAKFHADTTGALMLQAGYDNDDIKAVQRIILKENLRNDAEVQVMEDALCLVFLQFQLGDFVLKHDEEKVIQILKKTWTKMNQQGRDAALTLLWNKN